MSAPTAISWPAPGRASGASVPVSAAAVSTSSGERASRPATKSSRAGSAAMLCSSPSGLPAPVEAITLTRRSASASSSSSTLGTPK